MTNLKMFICAIALTASFNPLSASAQDCADGSITCGADYFDRERNLDELRRANRQYLTDKQFTALRASQEKRHALVREAIATKDQLKIEAATGAVRKAADEALAEVNKLTQQLLPLDEEFSKAHLASVDAKREMDKMLEEYRAGKLTVKQIKPYIAKHEAALAEASKPRPELDRLHQQRRMLSIQYQTLENEFDMIKLEMNRKLNVSRSAQIHELRAVQSGDAAFAPLEKAAKLVEKENKTIVKALRALGVGGAALGVIAGTAAQAGESDASVIASNSVPSKKSAPALINRPDAPDTFMSVGSVE